MGALSVKGRDGERGKSSCQQREEYILTTFPSLFFAFYRSSGLFSRLERFKFSSKHSDPFPHQNTVSLHATVSARRPRTHHPTNISFSPNHYKSLVQGFGCEYFYYRFSFDEDQDRLHYQHDNEMGSIALTECATAHADASPPTVCLTPSAKPWNLTPLMESTALSRAAGWYGRRAFPSSLSYTYPSPRHATIVLSPFKSFYISLKTWRPSIKPQTLIS